jgi:hypothetical protein
MSRRIWSRAIRALLALAVLAAPLAAAAAQWPGDEDIPAVAAPALPRTAPRAEGFVPRGWRLVDKASGDLNGDGKPDAALVIRKNDPKNRVAISWQSGARVDTNPWMLLAAFATAKGYELKLADHRLIPRHDNANADDEFDDVAIERGALKVKMHVFLSAGGWDAGGTAYTFRWQDGGFKLIGFDRDNVHRGSGETREVSINYLTGRKLVKTGKIESDRQASRWSTIPKAPLIDLTAIGNGLEFVPAGEEE